MKIVIILLIISLLMVGCGSPESEEVALAPDIQQQYKALRNEHIALQHAHNILVGNYDQLKEAKAEWDASLVKYGELYQQHGVLKANYDLVVAQYNSMTTYYEELFMAVAPDKDALEVMNEQYQALIDRHKVVDEQVALLRAGSVKEVSDNLTTSEFKVFNRGVGIWWDTFNK